MHQLSEWSSLWPVRLNIERLTSGFFFLAGLGSQAGDICGKDWSEEGGDYGDPGKVSCHLFHSSDSLA